MKRASEVENAREEVGMHLSGKCNEFTQSV